MKREPAPREYTCRSCPERYCHEIPASQKLKGLMMRFGESYCTLPKRARHLKNNELSRRAPEWCPKRKVPNTLRIYYYRDEYFENHFIISLEKLSLMLPPDFIEKSKSYN